MESKLICRTCGNYFSVAKDQVKPIIAMAEILDQLAEWHLQVSHEDGLPQHMCPCCIADFRKVVNLKNTTLELNSKFVLMKSLELNFCGILPVKKFCGMKREPIKREHLALVAKLTLQPAEPERGQPNEVNFDMNTDLDHKPMDWEGSIFEQKFPKKRSLLQHPRVVLKRLGPVPVALTKVAPTPVAFAPVATTSVAPSSIVGHSTPEAPAVAEATPIQNGNPAPEVARRYQPGRVAPGTRGALTQ